MSKNPTSLFGQLKLFETQIEDLEGKILELEQKMKRLLDIERNHMLRIKNGEDLSDDFIYSGRAYQDLSPDKAWKLYNNPNYDFVVIDVSAQDFSSQKRIPGAMHIPWSEFHERFLEIQSHTTPLLVISEDGANSVLACEYLVKRGFFNCNNVSGGYRFWKGSRVEDFKDQSA